MLNLLLALAVQSDEPARYFPPEIMTAPPVAVEHVAVMEVERGYQPHAHGRKVVMRSGTWIREQGTQPGPSSILHSDLASGVSVTYSRDETGRYRSLSISRRRSEDSLDRYRRIKTGERDRLLDEECEVWSTRRIGEQITVDHLTCETADGIQLWSRDVSLDTRQVLASSRTLELQRRAVGRDMVQPPNDLLRWFYSQVRRPAQEPVETPTVRPRNYEIHLESRAGGSSTQSQIMRRRGDSTYRESLLLGGVRTVWSSSPNGNVQLEMEEKGRLIRLSISPLPPGQYSAMEAVTYEPIQPESSEEILGERCIWSRGANPGGLVVTSGEHRQCVTHDALPLRTVSRHRGWGIDLTATRLRRARPRLSEMLPPASAFEWSNWGVELDR